MAVFGSLSTVRAQLASNAAFAAAFAYLDELSPPGSPVLARLLALPVGESQRLDLAQGVFALEQAYLTKERSVARMESHLQYVDIQVVVAGTEAMAVTDVRHCTVTENLTPAKDLIFYQDVPAASLLWFTAGEAAVFHPADAHMPGLAVGTPAVVRKVVLKVPVR
jgi:biofilm protein TabA